MTVARPRAKKPTDIDEVARVLRIFDVLVEELQRRDGPLLRTDDVLDIAERIAARTEDGLGYSAG